MTSENDTCSNIVVRLPNWVGDVVMAMPLLCAIRGHFSGARITVVCRPYVRKIIEGAPCFDEIIEDTFKGPFRALRLGFGLRKHGFDLALILPNSFQTALAMKVAGVPKRVGYPLNARGWLLTDSLPYEKEPGKRRKPEPMVDYYLRFAEYLGVADVSERRKIELPVLEESKKRADKFWIKHGLESHKPVVGLNPGAAYGSSKLWTSENWAAVADGLAEAHGAGCIFYGGPDEADLLREIAGLCKSDAVSTADEIVSLDDLKAHVKRLDLLVTTDTGPRHYAVAFDVPVVVLMGPTDSRYTDAHLEKTIILQPDDLDCRPCHKKRCPLPENLCMTRTTPGQVLDAAAKLLEKLTPG
ncbi:MAG: lipopolysaccharide heptosyltransferase II [Planctomycetota bacterium]|nr:MAG: lipopolysaccharide heptosyltransferase II [Planctomycetota bacterium]